MHHDPHMHTLSGSTGICPSRARWEPQVEARTSPQHHGPTHDARVGVGAHDRVILPTGRRSLRLHVIIDEEIAGALEQQARHEMMTKSALVRRLLRTHLVWRPFRKDPFDAMFAVDEFEATNRYEPEPDPQR